MLRYDNRLTSYADMEAYFKRVKTPSKGRPLKPGVRLYKEGKNFVIKMYSWSAGGEVPLFKVAPNSDVTFLLPLEDVARNSNSLVMLVRRIVPIHLCRYKKGVYRVAAEKTMSVVHSYGWTHLDWRYMRYGAPQYFKGIKFNLLTGECLNAQPDLTTTELPEPRKKWRSDLRRYKRGLHARVKVGALRGYIEEENAAQAAAGSRWAYRNTIKPKWDSEELAARLVRCMKANKYPADILQAFVRHAASHWWTSSAIDDAQMLKFVEQVFRTNSVILRRRYGVFGKTLHLKK